MISKLASDSPRVVEPFEAELSKVTVPLGKCPPTAHLLPSSPSRLSENRRLTQLIRRTVSQVTSELYDSSCRTGSSRIQSIYTALYKPAVRRAVSAKCVFNLSPSDLKSTKQSRGSVRKFTYRLRFSIESNHAIMEYFASSIIFMEIHIHASQVARGSRAINFPININFSDRFYFFPLYVQLFF